MFRNGRWFTLLAAGAAAVFIVLASTPALDRRLDVAVDELRAQVAAGRTVVGATCEQLCRAAADIEFCHERDTGFAFVHHGFDCEVVVDGRLRETCFWDTAIATRDVGPCDRVGAPRRGICLWDVHTVRVQMTRLPGTAEIEAFCSQLTHPVVRDGCLYRTRGYGPDPG